MIFLYQGFIKRRVNSLYRCSSNSVRKSPKRKVTRPNKCLMLTRPSFHPPLTRFISGHRLMQYITLNVNITVVYNCMYLWPKSYKYIQSRSYCLYCYARYGGEESLGNVTSCLTFILVKMDVINGVWHNVAIYKNVTTTLNKNSFY
jgi:hypothetical protein